MTTLHKIDPERRLYTLDHGKGYTCLGFDYCDAQGAKVLEWLGRTSPAVLWQNASAAWQASTSGTAERYNAYVKLMDAGRASGKRCESDLSPQLVGLEGWRVEVLDDCASKPRRFIVGKSTGWLPCHLEIARANSSGGGPASQHYAQVRKLEKVR